MTSSLVTLKHTETPNAWMAGMDCFDDSMEQLEADFDAASCTDDMYPDSAELYCDSGHYDLSHVCDSLNDDVAQRMFDDYVPLDHKSFLSVDEEERRDASELLRMRIGNLADTLTCEQIRSYDFSVRAWRFALGIERLCFEGGRVFSYEPDQIVTEIRHSLGIYSHSE